MEHGAVLCQGPPAREYIEKYIQGGVQQNWKVTCLQGNKEGEQRPLPNDIISFDTDLGCVLGAMGGAWQGVGGLDQTCILEGMH